MVILVILPRGPVIGNTFQSGVISLATFTFLLGGDVTLVNAALTD